MDNLKKYCAEAIGTMILVLFGCGAAAMYSCTKLNYFSNAVDAYTGIALTFGLVIVGLSYAIGNISGCHVNPAVSFAMFLNGKLSAVDFLAYIIAQSLGAVVGAGALLAIIGDECGLGTNGYGTYSAMGIDARTAFLTEVILTFVFVFVILGVTSKAEFSSVSGLIIGLTLALVHFVGLPLTGTSVNPARSLGAALLTMDSEILKQLWVFVAAPFVGAALAALIFRFLTPSNKTAKQGGKK